MSYSRQSVNKATVAGRLGGKPEVRYTNNGTAVANFSIATTEAWKDNDGNSQERTEWHALVAFAKTAEFCEKYLDKGDLVYVEGKLQTRSWDDKNGNKRQKTEIVADTLTPLARPATSGNNSGGNGAAAGNGQPAQSNAGAPEDDLDDLPF